VFRQIVIKNKKVYLIKTCPDHGQVQSLIEEDASWYMQRYGYDKAGTVSKAQTQIKKLSRTDKLALIKEKQP